MKKKFILVVIVGLLQFEFFMIQAQTTEKKLNQVELMKQFLGTWKCNPGRDSVETWIVKSFGNGFEYYATGVYKDKTYWEEKNLWGFNSKSETWMIFILYPQGNYATYYGKFISNNEIVWDGFDISNPEKIIARGGALFSSPDKFTFIWYTDGKKSEVTYNRIK